MKTFVVVNFEVPGVHFWKEAKKKLPQVSFLSHPHHHVFKIRVKKLVEHDDREIEIISYQRELLDYFKNNYDTQKHGCCDFGGKSCEQIAKDLMEAFDLDYCQVLEDGQWGAEIQK